NRPQRTFINRRSAQIATEDWLINVPSRIPVLESSCVVIPCVYSCPKKRKTFNRFRAFWYRGHTIVASNFPELRLTREFHHRTRMAGSIESGNCTWQLYFVRKTDTGPKTCLNNYLTSDFVKIVDCTEVPKRPVMTIDVRNKVTATCKVTHVCPTSPPHISWSRAGTWTTMSKQENKWLWSTTSTMTFIPRVADFNKRLECKVTFHGRKTTKGSVLVFKKRKQNIGNLNYFAIIFGVFHALESHITKHALVLQQQQQMKRDLQK
uniref:Ig-like domain-containing protein n=1 Tax=Poecilia mexicana TaxID=48701 RepID=A0A3B3XTN8_9TELE